MGTEHERYGVMTKQGWLLTPDGWIKDFPTEALARENAPAGAEICKIETGGFYYRHDDIGPRADG